MNYYENQRVADWAIKQVRERMLDGQARKGPWHASELYQCHRKTILHRHATVPYDRDSILRFAMGFAIQEWFFGPEQVGQEVFGIILSPDHHISGNILEFKSTRASYETYVKDDKGKPDKSVPKKRFDPSNLDHWVSRSRAYCAAFGAKKAHIIVMFVFQNDLHAWTLEFTDEELLQTQKEIEEKRDALDSYNNTYLSDGTLPPVSSRFGEWECPGCPYLTSHCKEEIGE